MPTPEDYKNTAIGSASAQIASTPTGHRPAVSDTFVRLHQLNSATSENIDTLRRITNRVIFGTETVPENDPGNPTAQPARAGLVGALEDIADYHGSLNEQMRILLEQISEHI
jgi:hypothetical protein